MEGLTEFLPVSSTGHLILAGKLLRFEGPRAASFEIIIQLGAVLAVAWERGPMLRERLALGPRDPRLRRLLVNLALGFLPAAMVGLLFHRAIKERLFAPGPVALALLLGGIAIVVVEKALPAGATVSVDDVRPGQALAVGLCQVLSLWPGVSRAAATILGGMGAGMGRAAATEYSFLLAIPVMAAATGLDLLKSWRELAGSDLAYLALAFAVSFATALLVVRALLRYVRTHDFVPFGVYRIALAALVLLLAR